MSDNEILIMAPAYKVKDSEYIKVRLAIREQLKHGKVVTIPFGWKVVASPSDIEVKFAEKPEEKPTPWDLGSINNNYSPFDSESKERFLFCTECGIIIKHYNPMYQYCPYCGKRHYFDKQESEE